MRPIELMIQGPTAAYANAPAPAPKVSATMSL
jgi:hypothetical protein